MILRFAYDGAVGKIDVRCAPNDDPALLGCSQGSLGLPACTATVASDARGYRAMLGWVQLVRSSDNASAGAAFEMDPFSLFADANSPYCFYGCLPTLFDGPSRAQRTDMAWLAHSFLAASPLRNDEHLVTLVAGFSWGFDMLGGHVSVREPAALSQADWLMHVSMLRRSYPSWRFSVAPCQSQCAGAGTRFSS